MLLFSLCASCGDEPSVATSRAKIVAGVVEPSLSSVVGVRTSDRGTVCSGVLVSPRVILTARHCVAPMEPEAKTVDCLTTKFGKVSDPSQISVSVSRNAEVMSDRRTVARVLVPKDPSFCGGDLAALVLTDPVRDDEATPMPLRLDQAAIAGESFTAVGIGRASGSPSGVRRRRDGLRVGCLGDACRSPHVEGNEWWGDGAVCEGDSGGPAIDVDGRVFGVASRKREGCSATIYTDVASSRDFVDEVLGEAARTPEGEVAAACSTSTRGRPGSSLVLLVVAAIVARLVTARSAT